MTMTIQPRYDVGPDHTPMTVNEIATFLKTTRETIAKRIRKGIRGPELIAPLRPMKYNVGPDSPKLTVAQIAKLTGLNVNTINKRLNDGISGADLLMPNQRPQIKYDVGPNHPKLSVSEIAKLTGLATSTVDYRIKKGITGVDLLAPRGHAGTFANTDPIFRYDVGPNHPKMSATEIAELTGLTEDAIHHRYRRGLRGSQLIEQQHSPKKKPIRKFAVGPGYPPLTVLEISKIAGVSTSAIVSRYNNGWRGADLLAPSQDRRKTTNQDKTKYNVGQNHPKMTIKEIAEFTGLGRQTIRQRLHRGVTGEKLLADVRDPKLYDVGPNHPKLSIDQIVKISGISKHSVAARIKRGVTGADLLLHRLPIGYYDQLD